jgi:hypothetical protein
MGKRNGRNLKRYSCVDNVPRWCIRRRVATGPRAAFLSGMRAKLFWLGVMLLVGSGARAQDSTAARPVRPVPVGTFEGQITYAVKWSGPLAAEFGRLLPTTLRLTFRGRQLKAETIGGLYPLTSLLDADSSRLVALDSLTRSAWFVQGSTAARARVVLSGPGASLSVAGKSCVSRTAYFTWPDPTPNLPKPPDWKPQQMVVQLGVSSLKHALGSAPLPGGLVLFIPSLSSVPLKVSGPTGPDRQLMYTLTATKVTARKVAPSEVEVPSTTTLRPFDPRGPIPGFLGPVGLSPAGK